MRVLAVLGLVSLVVADSPPDASPCPVPPAPWRCAAGHYRPPSACTGATALVSSNLSGGVQVLVQPGRAGGSTPDGSADPQHAQHERAVLQQWNATLHLGPEGTCSSSSSSSSSSSGGDAESCSAHGCVAAPAFFVVVPFHRSYDGGSNYYHFHIDLLLPLFLRLQRAGVVRRGAPVRALVVPTVSTLQWPAPDDALGAPPTGPIDWRTPAFDDRAAYWNRALELVTDLPVVPLAKSRFHAALDDLQRTTTTIAAGTGELCLCDAQFGLPSLEHPPPALVRRFVGFMRERLGLRSAPVPCDRPHTIGFVTRSNRRRLLNEAELLDAVRAAVPSATVEQFTFGSRPFDDEARGLQHVHVLVGGQGSGMLNAWYLPPESSAVVLYQFGAWDVFDEHLSPRGPYLYWVNNNESNSVCNRTVDRFCDSPDTVVDIPAAVDMIVRAFELSVAHCAAAVAGRVQPGR